MRLKALATSLCTLCVLMSTSSADARGVRWHRGLDSPATSGAPEVIARAYIARHAQRMGLTDVELAPEARVIRWRDQRVVRIAQQYDGLPVFNRVVILRIDAQGRVRTLTTDASADLDVVTRPSVTAGEALEKAAAIWEVPHLNYSQATLGVQPRGHDGRLIWRVDGAIGLRGTRTWVDAISGEVLHHFWRVQSAQGTVYTDNPVATPTPATITVQDLPGDATCLEGDYVDAWTYVRGAMDQQNPQLSDFTLVHNAVTTPGGDFHFTPTIDASQPDFHDPFAEMSVFYHVNRVYRYFRTVHGYTSTKNYTALANYGEDEETVYDNAFFSPMGANDYLLAMGQGSQVDLGYDGDVIYHEFGHSVIEDIAQMTYQYEMMDEWGVNTGPGGIHEGLADYWSSTITDDSVMGEYSLEGMQAGAGRDLAVRKICPDDVWGEVHDDGEVFGSAAWSARLAVNDNAAHDDIMYGALSMQTSRPTFTDFATGMQDAAQALVTDSTITQTQYDAMVAALDDHGLLDCGRAVTLADDERQMNSRINLALIAQMLGGMGGTPMTCEEARTANMPMINRPFPALPGNFQFKKTVPAGATSVTLRVRHVPGTDLQFWVYARRAELVHFTEQSLYGMITLVDVAQFDHEFGPFDSDDQTVTIDMTSSPALEPGGDYYFAITAKNCTTVMGQPAPTNIFVTGTTDDTPYTPDAGVDGDAGADAGADAGTGPGPSDKGCGCAQQGPGSLPLSTLVLALFVLGFIRRRR